ncbi:DedA family protein [Aquabacterium sp. A7-Y]|uniref:YqaA family protein n=1 Tax=Aquabacterium sp. A7-Y TaxID=1349605 RepID=UPI00223E12CF|nr:YqaA family protein [Aquabacterium sp. A7-Y]MCW7537348.1 DedA family protein [Aquabacterium sp. A7-Y]
MEDWFHHLLGMLALPEYGLSTLFTVALVSATLLPLGSEPALFGLLQLNPELLWPAIFVATAGNTVGGAITYWMGYGAEKAYEHLTHQHPKVRLLNWLGSLGPKACLLSWLPIVGDPLCGVAGWLEMPFWRCLFYMAIGKLGRYVVMTFALLWMFPAPGG